MTGPIARVENRVGMTIETVRGVSPLGSWTFSTWRPPQLAGLVDHVWAYSGPTSHRRKRVLPNGRVELLLNFGEPYRRPRRSRRGATAASHGSAARRSGRVLVEQPAHQHVMGVRLLPAGAYGLLSRPMREVTGLSVDLADLIGPAAGELAERCDAAARSRRASASSRRGSRGRLARSTRHGRGRRLGGRAARRRAAARCRSRRCARTSACRRRGSPDSSASRSASRRSSTRASCASTRRSACCRRAGAGRLTDVALDARFYDQPHMNAEFRALGGLTPSEFLAARHPWATAARPTTGRRRR